MAQISDELQNYKMQQILLQNAIASLFENTTEVYYTMRQVFYYKMQQFYYKMRRLSQITTVHSFTYLFKLTCKCFVRLPLHKLSAMLILD